ncbi:MAG TPA: pilus assembly protein TadG-related protein [Candidatus Dormibacteraeota bacterium]
MRSRQSGQAIVLIAIMLAVLVGMAALAIDGSRAYSLRRDLQAAVDAAALAAGDNLQQTGSYSSAEQAATTIFGKNMRLYSAPSCSPAYGAPGAAPLTVTCTYGDGTVLKQVVASLGPAGSQFSLTGTRSLALQFARILTNGATPRLSAAASGGVNNLLYTPALGALGQDGCGGAGGNAITISGSGTVSAIGDVVSDGAIAISAAALLVNGDVYARCQSSVPGVVSACYPSGASAPCTFPDVAGATRSGFHLADPNFPPPAVTGGSRGSPGTNAVLLPGVYASDPNFTSGRCWFLSGGVYKWLGGYTNSADFVSNELKPPDEAVVGNNTVLSSYQFWNTGGFNCAGSFRLNTITDARNPVRNGQWGVELTSVRTDSYGGLIYVRESAPSMCHSINTATRNDIVIQISNVPGATSYNVYLSPPGGGCNGPFGLAGSVPVIGTVSNNLTPPCPIYLGGGCSLGNEQVTIDQVYLGALWAPNALALPGTSGAYPPDPQTAPLQAFLPNQNPDRGAGAAGDRANENQCDTTAGALATCPAPITPGAVEFYLPSGGCMNVTGGGDNFVFSGYQYNWVVLYEPGPANGPANTCSNVLGAAANSAFTGFLYSPSAGVSMPSSWLFESGGMGGLLADTLTITGSPAFVYDPDYAPVPPASRLTG